MRIVDDDQRLIAARRTYRLHAARDWRQLAGYCGCLLQRNTARDQHRNDLQKVGDIECAQNVGLHAGMAEFAADFESQAGRRNG